MSEQPPHLLVADPVRDRPNTFFEAAEIEAAARERRVRLTTGRFIAVLFAVAVGLGVGLAIMTA